MFKYVDLSLRSVFSLAFPEAEVRGSSRGWRKERLVWKKISFWETLEYLFFLNFSIIFSYKNKIFLFIFLNLSIIFSILDLNLS